MTILLPTPVLGPFGGNQLILALNTAHAKARTTSGYHRRHGNLPAVVPPTSQRYHEGRLRGSLFSLKEHFLPRCLKYLSRRKNCICCAARKKRYMAHVIVWDQKPFPIFATQGLKPSLCPSPRDHPAGFGLRNYLIVESDVPAACSQVAVERERATSAPPPNCGPIAAPQYLRDGP